MTRAIVATVLLVATTAAAGPAVDWMLHCRGCHGDDGQGVPGAVPTLAGEVAKFLRVPGGREYLVRVPGVAQSELDDARLAALLSWMVGRFGPAVDAEAAPAFDGAEVRRLRAAPLVTVDETRAQLLQAIAARGELAP